MSMAQSHLTKGLISVYLVAIPFILECINLRKYLLAGRNLRQLPDLWTKLFFLSCSAVPYMIEVSSSCSLGDVRVFLTVWREHKSLIDMQLFF